MAPKAKAMALKAKVARAKAASVRKVQAKSNRREQATQRRVQQLDAANARQRNRRQAVAALNELTTELNISARPLVLGRDDGSAVENRVRLMQRRCPTVSFSNRLRDAAALYTQSGGKFDAHVLTEEDAVCMEVPAVMKHKILQGHFRLRSEAFMLTYHSKHIVPSMWPDFEKFIKGVAKQLGARAWAACLKKGTTDDTATQHHFHAYFYWSDGHGVDVQTLDAFVFADFRPRVDVRAAMRNALGAKLAAHHGLWYVAVLKMGTVQASTNFIAWRDYTPFASWIDGLWAARKLTPVQFLELSRDAGAGFASRARDAQAVMRGELEASIKRHIAAESEDLVRLPPRAFPVIDEFVQYFEGPGRWRRPMMVLLAPTNLGKSMLAEHVLQRVAKLVDVPGHLEVTVEADEHIDLSDYHHERHSGVLLDGVGDVLFLKKNREMLQGRPKLCKGGKSATNVYAYPFTLCRRAIVVTMDMSVANVDLFETDHWLSNPKNVILVRLDAPAWEGGEAPAPATPPVDVRTEMTGWSAGDVMKFMAQQDLAGPARTLLASGVNGEDLMAMATKILTDELRLNSFAARKILAVRDAHLHKS